MTTLALAVKFRALADQLSNTEFNTFITKLIQQQFGRNILLTSLFNQFSEFTIAANTNNFQQQTLTDIIAIIKNIMNARKIIKNAIITQNVSINALPSELIGEIASHLDQTQHIAFGKMNRHIYIGCNNPNTLKHLDLEHITDYSSINLRKYPQLQHLSIDLNKFNELPAPPNGTTVCNDISHLSLYADKFVDIDIDSFLSQKWLTFTNLKKLFLFDFGDFVLMKRFRFKTLHTLMRKFPMIEHLSLYSVRCDTSGVDDNALYQLLPNLHKLSCRFCTAAASLPQFVDLYHNKLTVLTFDDYLYTSNTAHNFSNLRDLSLTFRPTKKTINFILKTAINLQRIYLNDDDDDSMSPNDWKDVLNKLISEHKSLKYLKIATKYTNVDAICCGLERALFKSDTNGDFKINYKLIIKKCDKEQLDFEKLFLYISRIANELQSSNLTNFMFILKCEYRGIKFKRKIKKEWDKQKETFKNKKSSKYAIYFDKFMIVVTNKQCTINGYSESCFYAL